MSAPSSLPDFLSSLYCRKQLSLGSLPSLWWLPNLSHTVFPLCWTPKFFLDLQNSGFGHFFTPSSVIISTGKTLPTLISYIWMRSTSILLNQTTLLVRWTQRSSYCLKPSLRIWGSHWGSVKHWKLSGPKIKCIFFYPPPPKFLLLWVLRTAQVTLFPGQSSVSEVTHDPSSLFLLTSSSPVKPVGSFSSTPPRELASLGLFSFMSSLFLTERFTVIASFLISFFITDPFNQLSKLMPEIAFETIT